MDQRVSLEVAASLAEAVAEAVPAGDKVGSEGTVVSAAAVDMAEQIAVVEVAFGMQKILRVAAVTVQQ